MKIKYLLVFFICIRWETSFSQANTPTPEDQSGIAIEQKLHKYCGTLEKIYQAYDSGNLNYISALAAQNKKDTIIFPTCQLFRYLAKKIGPDEFIESFPSRQEDFMQYIYDTDPCDTAKIPKEFEGRRLPIFEYYRQLTFLMDEGDRKAMKKVLDTFGFAWGDFANEIYPYVASHCLEHPELVLKNWDIYREHQQSLVECLNYHYTPWVDVRDMKVKVVGLKGDEKSKNELLNVIVQAMNPQF